MPPAPSARMTWYSAIVAGMEVMARAVGPLLLARLVIVWEIGQSVNHTIGVISNARDG